MNRKDISFKTEDGRFNFRVAAVIIKEGKVLLLTDPIFTFPIGGQP